GDLCLGEARTFLDAGYLFRLRLNRTRREIAVRDSAIEDKVADNLNKFDITESESLLFGRDFGVGTDIQTGPNGNLFVVSLSNGAVYEIYRLDPRNRPGGQAALALGAAAAQANATALASALALSPAGAATPASASLPPTLVDQVFAPGLTGDQGVVQLGAGSEATRPADGLLAGLFEGFGDPI